MTVRRGYKQATVATAHRMLRNIHHMLSTGELQRDPGIDHEAKMVMRNRPRRFWMLKKTDLLDGTEPQPAA